MFDGYTHKEAGAFLEFIAQFGQPKFLLHLSCDPKELKKRWSVKNEDAEFPEEGDVVDEFNAQGAADTEAHEAMMAAYNDESCRVLTMTLDTSRSLESTLKDLRN